MADALTPAEAFKLAVSRVETQAVAGALIGRTQSRVSKMVRAGKACPPEGVLRLEAATGVSRHDLRPDIYPRDGETPRAGSLGDLEAAR